MTKFEIFSLILIPTRPDKDYTGAIARITGSGVNIVGSGFTHSLPILPARKSFDKQDDGQAEFPLIVLIGNVFLLDIRFWSHRLFLRTILPNNIGNIYNIWPLNPKTNLLIRFWNGHPCSGWGATKKTGRSATCKLQEAEIKVTVKQYLKKALYGILYLKRLKQQ